MIAIPAGFSPEEYLAIEQDALIRSTGSFTRTDPGLTVTVALLIPVPPGPWCPTALGIG
jgi:hypothetical protein